MKNISIDKKEYELDFEAALKTGVLKKKLAIGDKFKHEAGDIYILSEIRNGTGPRYAVLIAQQSGRQFSPYIVNISEFSWKTLPLSVFAELSHPFAEKFTQIS